jgi:hypothetical protein
MKKSYDHNPFESLENTLKREDRERNIANAKQFGNRVLESIGSTFRGVLTLRESQNPDTNRRAGCTAIAAALLAVGSLITLSQMSEPVECRTFTQEEFMVNDPNVLATQITEQLKAYEYGDSLVFDEVQARLFDTQSVEICGKDDIRAVANLTSKP